MSKLKKNWVKNSNRNIVIPNDLNDLNGLISTHMSEKNVAKFGLNAQITPMPPELENDMTSHDVIVT